MSDKRTLSVRLYPPPHGRMKIIEVPNISDEDIDFFQQNDIVVSMEDTQIGIAIYACPASDQDEESEIVVLSNERNCEDTMHELRQKAEETFT